MAQSPSFISREAFIGAVDHVIRERKTAKILRDLENCEATGNLTQFDETVRACVEVARRERSSLPRITPSNLVGCGINAAGSRIGR
jgi:hypothetical protein